ncbi:MAG: colicin E2 tolerance protein CbrC-like protein, partial [[Eubacterium] sulci]|nr:colicin E2 tolerance protein CbrC-like protein [[Eubacterium] sulci]
MNEYLKEYIKLKKNFVEQDEDKDSVLALYQFADRLALIDEKDAKEVLVDVYQQLYLMESAFKLFVNICDKNDRKHIKKLANLQKLSQSHGDRFALPRP